MKLVHKTVGRVSKEHVAERVRRKRHRRIELAGAVAFGSPGSQEFKSGRWLRQLGRAYAIPACGEKKCRDERGKSETLSRELEIFFRLGAISVAVIV